MLENLQAIVSIVLIDLALSGDNALVIGLAARGLPVHQRRQAIILGGFAAVLLRIVAASAVTLLLAIPYLQGVAAVALVVIAYRLVRPSDANESSGGHTVKTATTMREAVITILVADAVMSLENVLGVGAAAHGSIPLLAFGLALSIPIVLFGSDLVARLVQRFPWGIWLGVIALLWTAATMVRHEPALRFADLPGYAELVFTLALLLGIVALRGALGMRKARASA